MARGGVADYGAFPSRTARHDRHRHRPRPSLPAPWRCCRWTTSSRRAPRLPRPIFGYIAGAAEDNQSLRANRDAFARYGFVPRVLVNVSARSQQFDLFGRRYDAPFGIAPMGLSALSAYRGDIVQARAARASNIPAILSGTSLIPLEDVIQAAPAPGSRPICPAIRPASTRWSSAPARPATRPWC